MEYSARSRDKVIPINSNRKGLPVFTCTVFKDKGERWENIHIMALDSGDCQYKISQVLGDVQYEHIGLECLVNEFSDDVLKKLVDIAKKRGLLNE